MRRVVAHLHALDLGELPPAIRPGLHCGATANGQASITGGLPPAIRPGLHCGVLAIAEFNACASSFPRPSGRGSIAAPLTWRCVPF